MPFTELSPTIKTSGISISAKLPGVAAVTAWAISESRLLLASSLRDLSRDVTWLGPSIRCEPISGDDRVGHSSKATGAPPQSHGLPLWAFLNDKRGSLIFRLPSKGGVEIGEHRLRVLARRIDGERLLASPCGIGRERRALRGDAHRSARRWWRPRREVSQRRLGSALAGERGGVRDLELGKAVERVRVAWRPPATLLDDSLVRGVYFPRTAGQFRSTVTGGSLSVGTRALSRKRPPSALG
jgi:hypothetical protein